MIAYRDEEKEGICLSEKEREAESSCKVLTL